MTNDEAEIKDPLILERIERNRLDALAKLSKRLHEDVNSTSSDDPVKKPNTGDGSPSGEHGRHCESCKKSLEGPSVASTEQYYKVFQIVACAKCIASNENYKLMTKAEVQKQFLLPAGTINVLKFIEKENPLHTSWSPMHLYLRKEALSYSLRRWGSVEGIETERKKRNDRKWKNSLKKVKGAFKARKSEV